MRNAYEWFILNKSMKKYIWILNCLNMSGHLVYYHIKANYINVLENGFVHM